MRGVGRERLLVPAVSAGRELCPSCEYGENRKGFLIATHIVRELCPHSSSRDVPHEAFSVRTSTDKHNTLSSPCTVEQVDESQCLDTLAVPVSF